MLVEYWSIPLGKWLTSNHNGMSLGFLLNDVATCSQAIYRIRECETQQWEFFSTAAHPDRYTNKGCKPGGAAFFHTLPNEPALYPIIDLLTRVVYEAPPLERPDNMPNIPAPTTTPNSLVDIEIKRHEGKLVLSLNAKPLHDMLDSIGCRVGNDGSYMDAPSSGFVAIRDNTLSCALFLRREYPVRVALAQHYSRPATFKELKGLCESGHAVVKTILQHYQPVDIKYSIQKLIK